MNLVVYLLLAALVIYVLFTFFFRGGKKNGVANDIHLLTDQPDITPILSEDSANFTYSLWLYVNNWGTGTEKRVIFDATRGTETMQKLYFGSAAARLKYDTRYEMPSGTPNTGLNTIVITDAFPMQKWVHLVIVNSDKNIDFYIDGKLRHSATVSGKGKFGTSTIKFGKNFDCHVSKFYREVDTNVRAPIEVEREYLKGSGTRALTSASSSVHGSVQITKDGEVASQIRLF